MRSHRRPLLFSELATAFARLEATPGRTASARLVADLLAGTARAEIPPVVYLLQGQLRPPYEGVELGIGERLLARVLAQAYRVPEAQVARRYRSAGDLGLVAERLAGERLRSRLTVAGAYRSLLEIPRASGAGSTTRKTNLLAALLGAATPVEARYLVRIVQGRLRLGVGDATIIDAAAAGALGDRGKRKLIEQAYNVRSDLGSVLQLAYARGASGLARIGPKVGIPVRPALAQRLRSAEDIIERLGTVQAEPKYDGFRLQFHRDGDRVWAFSRRLEDVSEMFPDLTAAVRRQLRARRAILEGEAVGYDPRTGRFLPFQLTMTRKRVYGVAEAASRHPLRLFAFDLLYADGDDYLHRPQEERRRRLVALVRGSADDPVVVTEAIRTSRADELQEYFETMLGQGLEGIVAKRPDAPYRAGARGYDWVKLKRAYQSRISDTVDVVLVGYLAGRGARAELGIGSLLGAVYDPEGQRFRTVAKIGSGPSERQWKELRAMLNRSAVRSRPASVDSLIVPDVWVEPRLVVEVLADEITRSPRHTCGKRGKEPGYALRFPRMLDGVRVDRTPETATTEREVLDLYRLQSGESRAKSPRFTTKNPLAASAPRDPTR
ncbi:MAG: ATP-dependent DNA ligase [Gemmatimonadetes bacterium]|nr:ATP-dependent DNA ligase [Gemmatimonadota bacterium]